MTTPSSDEGAHAPNAVLASLANERTLLAWQRTAMSWGGAGAIVTRYFADDGLLRPHTLVGVGMLLVGALMWMDGTRRYRHADAAIRRDEDVTVPIGTIRAVWLATVVAIAAAVLVEVIATE